MAAELQKPLESMLIGTKNSFRFSDDILVVKNR